MPKHPNQGDRKSIRLAGWDYRRAGAYFITICTKDRVQHFGSCANGRMKLSTIGLIVQGCWYDIPRWNPSVELGAFIVMPNHLHGILILDGTAIDNDDTVGARQCHVPTDHDDETDPTDENAFYRNITPPPGSVSVIIGSFKSAATRHIRRAFPNIDFAWQERFYDHVVRNEKSFDRITQYIQDNPAQWKEDRLNN